MRIMFDKNILDKYYWFSWMSETTLENIINNANWDIEEVLANINSVINDKIVRIMSLCTDEEIETINTTENFDDILEIFEWIKWFSDNEYDILEERFNLYKKQSEK